MVQGLVILSFHQNEHSGQDKSTDSSMDSRQIEEMEPFEMTEVTVLQHEDAIVVIESR
jgi:hypothetical protein